MPRVKKEKRAKAVGGSPAKLAAFVDHPFPVYVDIDGKEREATVLSTGLIKYKDVEYKSPCAVATAMAKDVGVPWTGNAWTRLKYNEDGKRVALDTVRGSKSPTKKAGSKPKRVRKASKKRAEAGDKAPF